ncbi:MAG: tRNA (guanosine(37)-N1)-methyltransferase TrmD [Cryomorphaceae bacterium]|jgi:tRNA (guanine37-N1)-methyltransferase|nr:tRNA (guanosine(37)-N1)-methyltransferase TrmD [Cryomorphaceae bacterium]MBT3503163.1 tRNA (guanosine(37)-N1)-methyltransferase TrmD [Cryomorphaceae bacterium]MBT3689238.1 tRNA (guanosine(37)-N1)-methyltransferase TrmD [Cryomorphaceae bacterium]MBT4222068.1 tRNA (guanosine(37)-N1)-methyltransferase TrmD [Cryomorphaceae bacterium]MBT4293621.1 tRNA (guanosine(37)-N1)-methyltransferase TrmD [Cryomorphaceae bacterium]
MRIDVLTLFPEVFDNLNSFSIIKKAIDSNKVQVKTHNLRDYADNSRKVDDYPYGGFPGMVIKIEPIDKCIESLKKDKVYDEIIYLTPDGELLNQKKSNYFSTLNNIIIICGHYKGIDHRVREFLVTKEISIGDFVVSGGELPAAVLCDSIIRLLPGIIGNESSALSDTFQDDLLSPPIYTRPETFKGLKVPKVLLSGNDKEIQKWNDEKSLERTKLLRPNLFDNE